MENETEILSGIIQRRRSIFPPAYTGEEIPAELISKIVESANYAPTHKLTQPWRFIICRKEGKLKLGRELARLYRETTAAAQFLQKKYDGIIDKAARASCIIVINAQLHPELLPEWEEIAALGCAVQNMSLMAAASGVGAYWSSPAMLSGLEGYFGLAEGERCFGLFYMGFHREEPREAKRSPMAEKLRWIED